MVFQKEIILSPYSRGFHLITSKIINHIPKVSGIAHLFIKHTSASLTINENADPSVRDDFETHFNHMVSENENYFTHIFEGTDDMTSHIKSSLLDHQFLFQFQMENLILVLGKEFIFVSIEIQQAAED